MSTDTTTTDDSTHNERTRKTVERVKREEWFPEDADRQDAIRDVEQSLKRRYDIVEINGTEATQTYGGEWVVSVVGTVLDEED